MMYNKLLALIVVLFFAGSASASLVAHYTFDDYTADNQGGTAGAVANGTLESGATIAWDPGGPLKAPGPVVDLTVAGDYVNLGGGNGGWGDMDGTGMVTVMAWYKTGGAYQSGYAAVVAKGTGESSGWSINSYENTNADIAFLSGNIPDWKGVPSLSPNAWDGEWHHVVGQFQPEGDWGDGYGPGLSNIYIDGVLANSNTRWFANFPLSTYDILIGQEQGSIPQGYRNWNGLVDDVRIYDEFVSEAEIWDIYIEALIPEPATIAMLGVGGLALLRKRQRR